MKLLAPDMVDKTAMPLDGLYLVYGAGYPENQKSYIGGLPAILKLATMQYTRPPNLRYVNYKGSKVSSWRVNRLDLAREVNLLEANGELIGADPAAVRKLFNLK